MPVNFVETGIDSKTYMREKVFRSAAKDIPATRGPGYGKDKHVTLVFSISAASDKVPVFFL